MKKFIAILTIIALMVSMLPSSLATAYEQDYESPVVEVADSEDEAVDIDQEGEVYEANDADDADLDTNEEASESEEEQAIEVADITSATDDQTVLSILHINDVHGRFDVGIHYARFATIANEYRAQNPNTLVLDAGDVVHGTNFANMFRGESMIDLLNLVGIDALVAGNHEFNFGQDRLLELDARADFPILGANILRADGTNYLTPYTIIELDDVTVGIFGLATPTTPTVTNPNNVIGLTFTDPIDTAQTMVDHLRPQVDVVIALTHLGLTGVRGSQDLAAAVDGIDLIVEGHCHSVRPNGVVVNGTTIATVGAHAANLGTVEIILENGEVASVTAGMYTAADVADVVHDPAALALMSYYMDELTDVLAEHVGYSAGFLNNAYVRRAETALGNLTGDLFLEVTGADVAMMNSGGIRDHLHEGAITVGDVFNIFPFGNVIEVHEVSGQVLLDALENSVSMFAINNPIQSHGRFPQIAGMSFVFDISQEPGERISDLLIDGTPVDLTATYTMATSGFVGAGGDGFTMVPEYGTFIGEFGAIDENLTAFIRGLDGPVEAEIEGRMIMKDADGYVRNPDVTEVVIAANNFVIHVDDLLDMDVVYLSDATLIINDVVVDAPFSYVDNIDGIGIYEIQLIAVVYDESDDAAGFETFTGYVTVFVVDDTVTFSDDYVIFGDDQVTKTFDNRAEITANSLKEAANIEAYRVADAADVTGTLVVNVEDLEAVQTATEIGDFDVRISLAELEMTISLTLSEEDIDDKDCPTDPDPDPGAGGGTTTGGGGGTLPQTGIAVISTTLIGAATIGLGLATAKAKKSA